MLIRKIAILISFFLNLTIAAQNIDFRLLSIEEGLSNFAVNDIVQDSKGFLWIATQYGLNKYDGQNISVYNKSNYPLIKNNWVNCIFVDEDDILWLGTNGGGLIRFNPVSDKFKAYTADMHSKDSLHDNVIKDICADDAGNLWIGTSNGLYSFSKKNESFHAYFHDKNNTTSLSNNFINNVCFDSKKRLWVGTWNGGLNVMNTPGAGFKHYEKEFRSNIKEGHSETIVAIQEADDGTVWIGTWGNGAFYFDEKNNRFINLFEEKHFDNNEMLIIRSIHEDTKGNLYFGAFQRGLYIYNKSKDAFTLHRHNEYIPGTLGSNNIVSIIEDSSHVLWIATIGGGLSYYDLNGVNPLYYESQLRSNIRLTSNKVSTAFEDSNGRLWIATYDKGINIISKDGKSVKSISAENSALKSNIIFNMVEDTNGSIWLATAAGLHIIDRENLEIQPVESKNNSEKAPRANDLSDVYIDDDGITWLGYFAHGISAYYPDKKIFEHYLHDSRDSTNLTYNPVNCFYKDKDGILWIGMELGLGKFNTHTKIFTFYQDERDNPRTIPEENVQSIYGDGDSVLWIGTYGGGLLKFNKQSEIFTRYTEEDGLANAVIKGICQDSKERLWLATGKGISIFDKASCKITNLYDNFGFKPVFYNNITEPNDSILIFAGGGVCIVNTNTITESNFEPKINIVELSLYNKPVKIGEKINGRIILPKAIEYCDEITLTYKENVFTLDFAALHFSSPQNIKYKYKLEGFDSDWFFTDADMARATYTNLKGGKYIFNVYATNADGAWSSIPRKLKITIIPPFWETLWFRLLTALLIITVIYFIINWIIRKKQLEFEKHRAEQEKEIISLKNEKLQSEIEIKSQKLQKKSSDLTSSVVNNTRKNELLLKLKSKLETISENVNDQARLEIARLIREVKQDLNIDEHWDQFEVHFNEVHNNFIERLKKNFPDLTPANLKMCAYLRMNLSSKEIATLLNISISGVEKSRYRLRKKLALETEDNLVEFIMNY